MLQQDHLVIEHQGWLYKRGAAYKPVGFPKATRGSSKGPSPTNFSHASSTASNFSGPTSKSSLFTGWGKQEKSRFFVLRRRKLNEDSQAHTKGREYSELVYYTTDPARNDSKNKVKKAKFKGKIILRADNTVKMTEECQIILKTKQRAYYLRPLVDITENDAEAMTIATQWVNALEKCIKRLQRSRERMLESETESTLKTSSDINANSERKDEDDDISIASIQDYEYSDVWETGKFEGYLKIINHFGPAEGDSVKFIGYLDNQIKQFRDKINVMTESNKRASEPVIEHQITTYNALKALNAQDNKRLMTLKMCLQKLTAVRKQLAIDLQKNRTCILNEIGRNKDMVSQLKELKGSLKNSENYVEEKQRKLAKLTRSHALSEESTGNLSRIGRKKSFAGAFNRNKIGQFVSRVTGRMRSATNNFDETETDNPEELSEEIKNAEETQKTFQMRYTQMEEAAGESLKQSLANLQALDEQRLEHIKKAAKEVLDTELGLYTAMYSHCDFSSSTRNNVGKHVEAIDAEEDMKNIATELILVAEQNFKK